MSSMTSRLNLTSSSVAPYMFSSARLLNLLANSTARLSAAEPVGGNSYPFSVGSVCAKTMTRRMRRVDENKTTRHQESWKCVCVLCLCGGGRGAEGRHEEGRALKAHRKKNERIRRKVRKEKRQRIEANQ